MGFLSKKASASVNAGSSGGGYLQVSKLADGGSVRFALLAAQPLEGYEVWASSPEGQSKPFRFETEPTPEDVAVELGDFEPREGRGGPGTVDIKFFIAAPVYSYDSGRVQVMSLTQKSIIKELDAVSQIDEYQDLLAWASSKKALVLVLKSPSCRASSHSSLKRRMMELKVTLAVLCAYKSPFFFSASKVSQ